MRKFPKGESLTIFAGTYCANCIHNEDPEYIDDYLRVTYKSTDRSLYSCPVLLMLDGCLLDTLKTDEAVEATEFVRSSFIYYDKKYEHKCIMFKKK